jgi:hypothetical protein
MSLAQFRSAPTRIQFAKDGAWEQAWAFASGGLPARSDLRAYLAGRIEIAFEAFFGRSFFGVRIVGEPAEVEAFAARCLDAAAVRGPLDVFHRRLGLPLLDEMPAFAEVGCVNAWRSVGATRIWERGQVATDFGTMWRAALRSPVVRHPDQAKAIKFVYESPLPHWLGLPVSEPHELNTPSAALLRDALSVVAQAPDVPVLARCSSWGCTKAA